MRECSSCQTVNDDSAQFCLECGQKMAPAGRGPSGEQGNAPPTGGRPRLHSPILGGYEEIDDAPRRAEKPKNTAPKAKGAHLRSPLLGGGDDEDDEPLDQPVMKPGKSKGQMPRPGGGKMRSPLLGGGGGGGASDTDDYEEDFPLRDRNDDRSPFPHRSRPQHADPEMPAPQQHAGKAHLRSPLLGGSDDDEDYDDQPSQPVGRKSAPAGRPQKLHSPMFDRSSSGSGGYDDYDDDDADDIDDPNVLRSPLLAAKSRLPVSRQPVDQGQNATRGGANQPRPYPQNAPAAPGSMATAPPNNMGGPGSGGGIGLGQSNQMNQVPTYAQQLNQQPFMPPAPPAPPVEPAAAMAPPQPAFNAPPINIQQPGFAPSNPATAPSQNGLQSSPLPGSLPGAPGNQYEFGAPNIPLPGASPMGAPFPGQVAASQPPTLLEPAFQQAAAPPQPTKSTPAGTISGAVPLSTAAKSGPGLRNDYNAAGRSTLIEEDEFTLHPAVEDLAPLPKKKLGGGRFASPPPAPDHFDDDDDVAAPRGKGLPLSARESSGRRGSSQSSDDAHFGGSPQGAGAPGGPIMIVFITAFLGLIAKAYFIQSFWATFAKSMPMLLDQVTQVAVLVGLIVFAMQGNRK